MSVSRSNFDMGTSLATVIGLLSLATPYASANPIRTSMPKIAGLVDSSRLAGGVTAEGHIVDGFSPLPSASAEHMSPFVAARPKSS